MWLSPSKITHLRFCNIAGRIFRLIALIAALFGCTWSDAWAQSAKPPSQAYVPEIVKHLKPIGAMDPTATVDLVIGLPLRNSNKLEELLKEIYDPENERYARYLSPRQFNEMFAPSEADYLKLVSFARLNKLTVVTAPPNHTLLHVKASVANVERVFKVHMMLYRHPTEERTFFSPDVEPTIEAGVQVLHITGFNNYVIPRSPLRDFQTIDPSAKPVANAGSAPGGRFTGKDIRPAYAAGIALTGSEQAVGLLQFDGYYPSDIQAYEADAGLPNVPIQNVFLNGFTGTPSTTGNGNLETSLDIEMVVAMAPGVSKIVVYGGSSVVDLLNEMANPTQGEPLPHQLSTSWAIFYDDNVYKSLQQMATQGQSFFSFSGDNGAYTAYTMTSNDTLPFPPADSIYVTSVGGTVLQTTGPAGQWQSETAWSGSGGGPSPWFARPSWQNAINTTTNHASTVWRECPDVAMVATNIWIVAGNGVRLAVGGTSASSPLWAGYMALVNGQAAIYGRPPLGFLNPRLYAIGEGPGYAVAFHDVTTGNNAHANTAGNYDAVAGYDLVTGWGTPNGAGTLNALVYPSLCQRHPEFCYAIYDPFWWLKCPACGIDIFINLGDDFREVTVLDSLGRPVGRFERLEKPILSKGTSYNYRARVNLRKGVGLVLMAKPADGRRPELFKPNYVARSVKQQKRSQ